MAGTTCLLLSAVALSGCVDLVPTVHAIYRDRDVFFEPALLGTWSSDPSRPADVWDFRKGDGASYRLLVVDGGEDSTWIEAHLVRIGRHSYLDLVPESRGRDASVAACFNVPLHSFVRIDRIEPELVVSLPEIESFETYARAHPREIDLRTRGARSVIVSPPWKLRAFLARYAEVEGAFTPFEPRTRVGTIGSVGRGHRGPASEVAQGRSERLRAEDTE